MREPAAEAEKAGGRNVIFAVKKTIKSQRK